MTMQQETTADAGQTGDRTRRRRGLVGAVAVGGALIAGVTVAGAASGPSPERTPRPAAAAAATLGTADAFVPVTPVRVLDTRGAPNGPVGVPTADPMGPGEQIDLTLAGDGQALPAGATAAVLNIAIDQDATMQSYLTVWPQGEPRPFTAANNAEPGQVAANFTMAKLGATGGISLYNQQGNVNVVIDLVGYTVPLSSVTDPTAALSAWGTFAGPTDVAADAPITFGEAGPVVGTDVTQTDDDTFTFATAGVYEVDYRLTTSGTSPLGSVQLEVAGTPIGPVNLLAAPGGVLADTVLVTVEAGDTLELVAQGAGIGLAAGDSSRISISLVEAASTAPTTTTPTSSTSSTSPASSSSSSSSTSSTTTP